VENGQQGLFYFFSATEASKDDRNSLAQQAIEQRMHLSNYSAFMLTFARSKTNDLQRKIHGHIFKETSYRFFFTVK
jgi:hypothetical protein